MPLKTLFSLSFASLSLALAACAGGGSRDCLRLAGPGWAPVPQPTQAPALLALEGMPADTDARWYAHGDDGLLACIYAPPINNPACSTSTAYFYSREAAGWQFKNLAVAACTD